METLYQPYCWWCWVKFTHTGHVILQLILYKLWSKMLLWAFQSHKLPILTSQLHLGLKSYPKVWMSYPYFIIRNKEDIKHFPFILTLSYHWETLFKPHYQWWCWVKFTHAGHVILQLILYKLWSKTSLQAVQPINCQFWHYSCIWLKELPQGLNVIPLLYL